MPETMACQEYQDRIYLLQRGELEPAGAAAVRSHVEGCARCLEAYEAEETLTAVLAGATRHAAPPGLKDRVAAAMRAEAARGEFRAPRPRSWADWFWRPLVPAAVGAVAAVLVSVPLTYRLATRPPAPIVLLARHLAQEYERVEYTRTWEKGLQAPEAALAYLAQWLDVGFPKPPVRGGDLTMLGAQPTYFHERKAAAFVYQDKAGRTVTLFVFRGGDVQLPETGRVQVDKFKPYFSTADGYTLCVWKQKDAGFSMVGKMSQEELAQAFLKIRQSL